MRWKLWLGLTLSLAACRETVVLDQGPFDGSVGGVDGAPTNCGPPMAVTPLSPTVMVALDRSTGMNLRFGNTTVVAAVRAVLDQEAALYQKVVNYGYAEFPTTTGLCNQCGYCAGVVAPNPNFRTFMTALHACDPYCPDLGSQRPTTAALTRSADVFGPPNGFSKRYVLLITNGRPDCGSGQGSSCGDGGDAQMEIGQLAFRNIGTYLVAPGQIDPDAVQCLRDLAVAGGFASQQAPYYSAPQDQSELTDEVGNILHTIATDACEIDLSEQVRDSGRVQLYWRVTTQIPHDRNVGWEVSSSGYSIVLHDKWCERLIADGKDEFTLYTSCPEQPHL